MGATFLIIVGVVVLAAFQQLRRQRQREWARLAERLGFQYRPQSLVAVAGHQDFLLFSKGRFRKAANVITRGVNGIKVQVFDYSYRIPARPGQVLRTQVCHSTVAVFETRFSLTPLVLQPEGSDTDTFLEAGFRDVEFEASDFSRYFRAKSKSPDFARKLIHPRMQELLLSRREINLEMNGNTLLIYYRRRIRVNEVDDLIKLGMEFIGLLPEAERSDG